MLAGVNREERQRLLDMARAQLPPEVWSTLLAGVRMHLPARELQEIEQRYGTTYSPPS
jgi:hypothetical protein